MARQRNLAEQQERLSEATWSVLTESGLTGLTIRAVAERAGCTTGLVMHAFPTKEALLLHARDLLHNRTAVRADAAESDAATPGEALLAVLLNAVSPDAASPDAVAPDAVSPRAESDEEARVWVSFLAASLADPTLAARHTAGNRSFLTRVTRLLATVRPDWTGERVAAQAIALVALAEGLTSLGSVDRDTYSADIRRRTVTDALARALGPESALDSTVAPAKAVSAIPTTRSEPSGIPAGHRIRPFEPRDADAVVALWRECGLTRPWNDPHRDIERKLTTQPELFLVIESSANGTRSAHASILGTVMASYDGHRGWVNYLAVAPSAQGRGLGRLLMQTVEQRLLERGCPKINLQIREGNEPVLAFYRTLGYTPDAAVSFGKRLIPDDRPV